MPVVVNRISKIMLHALEGDYDPQYWLVDPDLSGVAEVPTIYWQIDGDTVREMTEEEKFVVDEANMPMYRAQKIGSINVRTAQLEAEGFEYPEGSGKRISMDADTRVNVAQMKNDIDNIPFPFPYNYVDDSGVLVIANASEMLAFYQAGLQAYLTMHAIGTQLKEAARAATTKAELEAIVDPR